MKNPHIDPLQSYIGPDAALKATALKHRERHKLIKLYVKFCKSNKVI